MSFSRGKKLKAETFDVFDTCLSRKYSYPEDLFVDLAREFIIAQPKKLKKYSLESIALARSHSQKLAYAINAPYDPTLVSIYSELGKLVPELDLARGMEIEKNLESKSLVPCLSARDIVNIAREKYGNVIFISDMYMPKDFICEELARHGFLKSGDKVYVSSEQCATKSSGLLFEKVANTEQFSINEALHSGDNEESDVNQPISLGMKSRHMQDSKLSKEELVIHEKLAGLSGYAASRIVGAARCIRISRDSLATDVDDLVSTFTAPFLLSYAEWIIHNCLKQKINNVFLSSRDCLGLYWILSELIKVKCLPIRLNYVQISRSSLAKASLYRNGQITFSFHSLRQIFRGQSVSSVLSFLGMSHSSYLESAKDFGFYLLDLKSQVASDMDWENLELSLKHSTEYPELLSKFKAEREAADAYFNSIGLSDSTDKFVVDLIVNLNCADMLDNIVNDIQGSGKIYSLFLAVGRNVRISSLTTRFKSVFNANFDTSDRFAIFFDRVDLLELLLSCDAATPLSSYRDVGHRLCHVDVLHTPELRFRKKCGISIWNYSKNYVASLYEDEGSLRALMLILVEHVVLSPRKKWLVTLEDLHEFDETFYVTRTLLADPLCISPAKFKYFLAGNMQYQYFSSIGYRRWRVLALANTKFFPYLLSLPIYEAFKFTFKFIRMIRIAPKSHHSPKSLSSKFVPRLKSRIRHLGNDLLTIIKYQFFS